MRSKPHVLIQGLSELLGTFVLVFFGIGAVLFCASSIGSALIPEPFWQRLFIGAWFGLAIVFVSYSPFGSYSGAHLNPAVTLWQRLRKKCTTESLLMYWVSQGLGSVLAIWLLAALFPTLMKTAHFGMTNPGSGYPLLGVLASEIVATFIVLLTVFLSGLSKKSRPYTAIYAAIVITLLVAIEAPISGTSLNPARSFGPAFVAGNFSYYWIYVVGPMTASVIGARILTHR
jgi:aquaporin Z